MRFGAILLTLLPLPVVVHAQPGETAPQRAATPRPAILEVVRIVTGPSPLDLFRRPAGALVDAEDGLVFVADRGNQRIVILDRSGRSRGSIRFSTQARNESPVEPHAIARDPRGRLYVIDDLDAGIRILTGRGSQVGRIELPLENPGNTQPRSVAAGASGTLYILYSGDRNGIAVLDERGRVRRELGVAPEAGTLSSPVALAVRADENVLAVVDPQADRQILLLTPQGRVIKSFGVHGEGDGTFSLANHVTWGPGDTLWITDTLRHSISVFSSTGTYLGRIGGFGRGPGQFLYPVTCGFLSEDQVVVVERGGQRCQVLTVEVPSIGDRVSALPRNGSQIPEA